MRGVSSVLVVAVGWLYLMPQFQGAGLSLGTVAGTPPWVGGVLVGAVVLVNVLFGGMRSITFVQAFQYWLKLTALLVPVMFLLARVDRRRRHLARRRVGRDRWRPRRRVGLAAGLHERAPAVHDVLPDRGDVPRHDGPAARRGALLHQPRRPRRPSYDARGAGAARAVLPAAPRVRRPRPALRPGPAGDRCHRHGGARAARPGWSAVSAASCSPRSPRPARSRRSCPRPRG